MKPVTFHIRPPPPPPCVTRNGRMLENTHVSVWLGPHDSVQLIHGGPDPSGERNLKVTLLENTVGNSVFGTQKGMHICKL